MSARGVVSLLALLLVACTDVAPPSGPGTLAATLHSPHGDEGAAVLLLLGEGVDEVVSVGDTEAYASTTGSATRVVLINQVGGTLTFAVRMADVSALVVALVQEVAGPDDDLRPDLSGYRVELAK